MWQCLSSGPCFKLWQWTTQLMIKSGCSVSARHSSCKASEPCVHFLHSTDCGSLGAELQFYTLNEEAKEVFDTVGLFLFCCLFFPESLDSWSLVYFSFIYLTTLATVKQLQLSGFRPFPQPALSLLSQIRTGRSESKREKTGVGGGCKTVTLMEL